MGDGDWHADILFEDTDLLAVAKPAGLTVVPATVGPPGGCLRERLESARGERLWVVHRIDREASGLVVFARTAAAHRALSMDFEQRKVRKTYVAYVAGALDPSAGRIDVPLHAARRGKARPAAPGEAGAREALTEYEVESHWLGGGLDVSRVEARPATGRHHQVRVHLRARGTPVLFDPLYGRGVRQDPLRGAPCRRLALHAHRLALRHPRDGRPLELHAPVAPDLVSLEDWLGAICPRLAVFSSAPGR